MAFLYEYFGWVPHGVSLGWENYRFSVFLSMLIDDRIKEGSNALLEHQD
jgi:hypothetical protein